MSDLDFLRGSCALRKNGWEPREPGNRNLKTIEFFYDYFADFLGYMHTLSYL